MDREKEFLKIIDEHQGILHKICRTYTDVEDLYEDLFQDMIVNLWNNFETFEGRSKISTWMYKVALYTAINFRKYHSRRRHKSMDTRNSMNSVMHDDQTDWIYTALSYLKPEEKGLMILHLEGHSYQEIADIVGITESNVGARLSRIRKKLEKILKQI